MSEFLAMFLAGFAAAERGEFVGGGVLPRAPVAAAGEVLEEGVEHGEVVDYDGDEGFADRPFAGLFSAVGSRL